MSATSRELNVVNSNETRERGGAVRRKRVVTILAGAVCASLLALAFAGSASAKIVNLRVYDGTYPGSSFFGEGSVGPGGEPFSFLHQMDINQANGDFIVGNNDYWYKLNSSGTPTAFAALGTTTMVGTTGQSLWSDVSFDNSGGGGGVGEGEQGRIYGMSEGEGSIKAWKANGEPVSGGFNPEGGGLHPPNPCGFDVGPDGDVWSGSWINHVVTEFNPDGTPTGKEFDSGKSICGMEIDESGNFYISDYGGTGVWKFSPTGTNLGVIDPSGDETRDIAVDNSDGHIYTLHFDHVNEYDAAGALVTEFGAPEGTYPGFSSSAEGIAVNEATHEVYVAASNHVDAFKRTGNITIPDVTTEAASVTASTATLHGTVDRDVANGGAPINSCFFQYGQNPTNLEGTKPCEGSAPFSGAQQATITGLTTGTTYYYKLTASNEENGVPSSGAIKELQPAGPPEISEETISEVNTDGATISAKIVPAGSNATYWIEFGTTTAYGEKLPEPPAETKDNLQPETITQALSGLTPGSTYHFRVVAENANDVTEGNDHAFTTFPSPASGPDTCANAQVRQQTGASRLLDCRAYELASAADTNGYDVTSSLVPGQTPLREEPGATNGLLYSLQFGTVPNSGDPTNFGQDPYVATRNATAGQWETKYVGIPASGTPSAGPFGSPLADASSGLTTFAFGNGTLCDPCFSDGSTGIPVHLPNGTLVQGLKGSIPNPGAEPAGFIGRSLSDDGTHLVFGSTSKLENAATEGDLTIYERDLSAGSTQVVSTLPDGSTMTGTVAGLDVSADGSRVLVGKAVSTDAKGNTYYDLYMHIGNNPKSVQVADTTHGVLFNGMTSDGSKVFFTTVDQFPGDTDTSADLYRADVTTGGASVTRVSTGTGGAGGAGDTDTCDPVPGKESSNWNTLSSGPTNCGVLALAGGAGVASGDGTVFFLSPEELDGHGTLDEPNLFVARPGGEPKFVATIEPIVGNIVTNALNDSEVHRYEDFQVSSNGDFAVLASTLPLTELDTFNRSQVYRYDTDTGALVCASCATTGATPTGEAKLSSGLNLTDDGTVFFTSVEPLVLRDTNNRLDVYEWEKGKLELVSTGISNFDAGLLGATSDGVNVFFYTRETLAPQDKNGETMKVYDARAGGGFLQIPPLPLCAAKDECHGPSTIPAPPPQIGTFKGEGGNVKRLKCKKPKVKRNGRCVKKPKPKKKKGKRSHA